MPESWLADAQQDDTAEPAAIAAPRVAHRLLAVMVNRNGGHAIIDGKCLLVGQARDGMRLISVTKDSAVLETGGRRITLKLDAVGSDEPQVPGDKNE